MPRIDRLKEELGWLKVVFAVTVAIDASLIAWLVQNHGEASREQSVLAMVAALAVSFMILFVVHRISLRLKELEDL